MSLLFWVSASSLLASCSAAIMPLSQDNIDWGSLHCPQNINGTLPTPTYGNSQTVFTVCTELAINASPLDVYTALVDFNAYHIWNSFVYQVDLPANVSNTPEDVYVGMSMTYHTAGVIPLMNTTSTEVVTVLDASGVNGYLMAVWRNDDGADGSLLRAEHPNILVDLGNNATRYVSYETYYEGLETPAVLLLRENLQTEFARQGQDLKAYLEQ